MIRTTFAFAICAALLTAACYSTPQPECSFHCGEALACPDGYTCAGDGWCKRNDVPADFNCEGTTPLPDASDIDAAPPPDVAVIDAPLPPDADTTPDAPPPPDADTTDAEPGPDADTTDADTTDADTTDAFINSPPVITVPVSSPQSPTACVLSELTVTASDPDEPGQTVTLSATPGGSFTDPFPSGAAVFTAASGEFDFQTCVLDDFDVTFTATDDHTSPASDSDTIVFNVQPHLVVINEFRTLNVDQQDIELHNDGGDPISIENWELCASLTNCYVFAAITLPADGYLVIHWNQAGTDTATELFTGLGGAFVDLTTDGNLGLFLSSTHDAENAVDGVVYGGGAHTLRPALVSAGQWPPTASIDLTFSTSGYSAGDSVEYDGAGQEVADWVVEETPTFGSANL